MPRVSTKATLGVRLGCETCSSSLHKQAGIGVLKNVALKNTGLTNIAPKNTGLTSIARICARTITILKSITRMSIAPTMRERETMSLRPR